LRKAPNQQILLAKTCPAGTKPHYFHSRNIASITNSSFIINTTRSSIAYIESLRNPARFIDDIYPPSRVDRSLPRDGRVPR
jgi:hypothetical protein